MSSHRIATMSASMAVIGLNVALGVAPPADAEPCTGAVANAMPPQPIATPAPQERPLPWPFNQLPLGHKPANANDKAPLPSLGKLPLAILSALSPNAAKVDKQAAVVPPRPPNVTQSQPAAPAPAPMK